MLSRPTRHIRSIDGLRALAVIAVALYHLGFAWIPGGFLGVDLFFVISGYVITRLLLDNIETANGLDLRGFYAGRARRLLPGLAFLLIMSTLLIALFAPDAITRFLQDIPFSITGLNNWRLVALHQDYFQAVGRPPLLQHTWSLAVESQYYLLWPLVLVFIWKYFGKKNVARVALFIGLSSGVALFLNSIRIDSAVAMQISHIYFGTDTHSIGLFLGSSLAVFWIPQNLNKEISERAQDFVDGMGIMGFFGLLCCFFFVSESNTSLYRIAFPLAALCGCATLISIVHPASRFAPIMRNRVLTWIGERSYGIYLWHWVIFQITRPSIDIAGAAWALDIARILVVLAMADISLRYIEIPVRSGAVAQWLRGMKYRSKVAQLHERRIILLALAFLLVGTTSASAAAIYESHHDSSALHQAMSLATAPSATEPEGLWVTGDSIILGVKDKLAAKYPLALINARVGRQIQELTDVVKADQPQVSHATVVLDLGNNNHLTKDSVVTLLELLKNQPRIILVNTAVPRVWKADNNRIIKEVAANYPQVKLVDWAAISTNHPEFFTPDGVHLVSLGGDVYTAAIVEALQEKSPTP